MSENQQRNEERAYQAWLHCKADRVCELLQRNRGQTSIESMPRLQRALRDVLIALGKAVDQNGRHFPLAETLVLLSPEHARHAEVFAQVQPFLDQDLVAEFQQLHVNRCGEGRPVETESTISRLYLLSPLLKTILNDE